MARFTIFVCVFVALCLSGGASAEPVKAWEGTLDLETYPWLDDPNPVFDYLEGSIYYPYTRQDHLLRTKETRTYRALFLENEYLKITCLPELGGRIHSVWDKTTNHEVFHTPGIIKPALIAMRGAWIAGGIEWNAGPQGHTVTIVSPVDATLVKNPDGSATLVVTNIEKMFRTRWTVRLTLHPGKSYLDETIRMFNPTDGAHTYYFWNNTAFPNLEGTRFIFPMSLGSDHNGEQFFSWPIHEGVDMTYLKNYPTMSSVFAYDCDQDFFGGYDVNLDRGIVSHADHQLVQGKKAWTWGTDDFGVTSQMGLSDSGRVDAPYIEVQSGPLLTQADYGLLKPLQEVSWREYWYSVHGLGDGFEFANRDVAVNATRKDSALELRFLATGEFVPALCVVSQGGKALVKTAIELSPAKAAIVNVADVSSGPVDVAVFDAKGMELLAYTTPLAIKPVNPPDLAGEAAWKKAQPAAVQAYMDGELLNRENKPEAAKAKYEEAIAALPGHVPALTALATLLLERGDYEGAIARSKEALRVDGEDAAAWYTLGAAQLASGDYRGAIDSGQGAARTLAMRAEGYSLAARAHMRLKEYTRASELLERASALAPENTAIRDWRLTAQFLAGTDVREELDEVRRVDDPTNLIAHALGALAGLPSVRDPIGALGEKEFTVLEAGLFFMNLGLYDFAIVALEPTSDAEADGFGPLPWYFRAWCQAQLGHEDVAKAVIEEAIKQPHRYAFPAQPEGRAVLAYAASVMPDHPEILTLQGCLEAALYNPAGAAAFWEKAAAQPGVSSVPLRLLALDAWKVKKDLPRAEAHFKRGIEVATDDQMNYRDLALVLAEQKKTAEALALVESMPQAVPARFDIVLWQAEAYLADKRFDDCLALLKEASFTNYEGSSRPHDIFEAALTARGKVRYESGQVELALADFSEALTYPEYLEVGARYILTDAELRYWQGQCLAKLGRLDEAMAAWKIGAEQMTKDMPAKPYINVDDVQDEHVNKCAAALALAEAM